ncbi:MAG: YitT family protein, partial [Oscillospiraceae bacterium]|nr:YitT family protein [Oscillospiraceae bacterium]
TDRAQEINAALLEEFKCGTTKIAVTGGYSNKEKTIIYFVVNRFEIYKMKTIIHAIDPKAFVTISEVADVFRSSEV